MSQPARPHDNKKIAQALNIQLILILCLTAFFFISFGQLSAQAYIVGSLISWLGSYVVAKMSFRYTSVRDKDKIVKNMYRAHLVKWLLTMFLFVTVLTQFKNINTLFLFLGFILTQLNSWIYLIKKI